MERPKSSSPTGGNQLPVGYECAKCLYDLSAASYSTCPECGHPASEVDIAAFYARQLAGERIGGWLVIQCALGVAICAVFSIGALGLTGSVLDAIAALVVCAAAFGGSIVAGLVASRFARPPERAAYFFAWLRTHLWLNVAWLSAPFSGLLVVVALGEKLRGHSTSWGWLSALAVIGPMFWLFVQGVCAIRGLSQFFRFRREMQLRGQIVRLVFVGAATTVLLGSFLLGLMAGTASFGVANKITPTEFLPNQP